jgi:DNA-binding CsgD family transcriptional regulator
MNTIKFPQVAKCNPCACNGCATSELGQLYKLNMVLDTAYEVLGVGLVFFDVNGKVTHFNDLARSRLNLPVAYFLDERDLISDRFDELSAQKIKLAIRQLITRRDKHEVKLNVLINNINCAIMLQKIEDSIFGTNESGVVMFLFEPKPDNGTILNDVTRIFSLTQAEAKLTLALVNGMTASEYAEQQSISINTVYSQIKDILAKTGARRQVELVKLVLQHSPSVEKTFHNSQYSA